MRFLFFASLLLVLQAFGCSETGPDATLPAPDRVTGNCDLSRSGAYDYYFFVPGKKIACVSGSAIDSLTFENYTYVSGNFGLWHLGGGTVLRMRASFLQEYLVFVNADESEASVLEGVPGDFEDAAYDVEAGRLYALSHTTEDDGTVVTHITVFDTKLNKVDQHRFEASETEFRVQSIDASTEHGLVAVSYFHFVPDGNGERTTDGNAHMLIYDLKEREHRVLETLLFERAIIPYLYIEPANSTLLFNVSPLTHTDERVLAFDLDTTMLHEVVNLGPNPDPLSARILLPTMPKGTYLVSYLDQENTLLYQIDGLSGTVTTIHQIPDIFRTMDSASSTLCLREFDAAWARTGGDYQPEVMVRLSLPDLAEVQRDTVELAPEFFDGGKVECGEGIIS